MGTLIIILLCSVAPAFLLLYYARYRDRKQPEPWRKTWKGVWFGILSVALTILLHLVIDPIPYAIGLGWLYDVPLVRSIINSFYGAAIPEETAKLLMLWLLLRKSKDFDQYMDGVYYAVCVGMGFAGLENITYVFSADDEWQSVAIARSLTAVPGHYIFAVLMGFFYSIVHFQPKRFAKYKNMVWLMPVLAHGIYDTICFLSEEHMIFALLSYPALIWFCIKFHKFCYQRINKIELLDEDQKDLSRFTEAMKEGKRQEDLPSNTV